MAARRIPAVRWLALTGCLFASGPVWAELHDAPGGGGALAGRTVVLSAGHGYKPLSGGGWGWQRGTTPRSLPAERRLREDIHTNEIVIEYLQRYLSGAGATVFTCRERSFSRHEVIVDDADPAVRTSGNWTHSSAVAGYRGSGYLWAWSAPQETAVVRFEAHLPVSGRYPVYLWYTPAPNRSDRTLVRVVHAGGVAQIRIDQRRYRPTWFYLGHYRFEAGSPAVLEVSNAGGPPSSVVVADAVRFGAGIGPSGEPRWRECALAWLPHAGFAAGSASDVTIRPRFANWLAGDPAGRWREDWRYVSLHTNAGSGNGRGTMTLVYTNGRSPAWSGWGTGPAHYPTVPSPLQDAADAFAARMQSEIVRDLSAFYPPWRDLGVKRLNAGELRACTAMPSCLVELAYHDNPEDAAHLRNDGFRHTAARAIYKAIARSFDPQAVIVPLPPTALRLENVGGGRLRAAWAPTLDALEPSATPTSYRVYTSTDGRAYGAGRRVAATEVVLGPFPLGTVLYVRVSAVNAGGEGLASRTVAARVGPDGVASALLVDGFTRAFSHNDHNTYERWRGDHLVLHASAFARATALGFDSAMASAVQAGAVALGGYGLIDWILGRESSTDETFGDDEQQLVASYLAGGGALLVSGTEIGWDLEQRGRASDRAFYRDWLRAAYVADDAGTRALAPLAGGPFAALPPLTIDDGTHGVYDAAYPDVIRPVGGSTAVLRWDGGRGGDAAIAYAGGYRLLYLAFPLETVWRPQQRERLVAAAVSWLLPGAAAVAPPTTGGSAGTGGAAAGPPSAAGCRVVASSSPPTAPGGLVLLVLAAFAREFSERRRRRCA
ncbi:MAG: hypothetical protein D6776_06780 [Planctomycetota bacterium]|nr:MAG: hypothetical protein D6776_06780 [Planctomycetota bacterium]